MVKHNGAGGSLTMKEAVITSVKVAAIVSVLYVLGYFFIVLAKGVAGSATLARLFMKTIPIYPNSAPEDLNIEMIESMSSTVLLLDAIAIIITLYLKSRKKQ